MFRGKYRPDRQTWLGIEVRSMLFGWSFFFRLGKSRFEASAEAPSCPVT